MKKIKTLKKNYEFKNVMSKGKFFCEKYITVYISKNNLEKNVIGIAVSTKSAKAVMRNRIKRLIRENFILKRDIIKKGYNIVFLWNKKNEVLDTDFHKIEKDMDTIFRKADLYL